jgi:SHS2 domain-containing protein
MTDHRFQRVEHTADEAFRLSSDSLVGLFHAGAAALLEVMTVPEEVTPLDRRSISLAAEDLESLLVAWLNELIYLFETEGMLFSAFEITIEAGPRLEATARGERHDPGRHPIDAVVKAATFQNVAIREHDERWETDIVFDV